MYLVGNQYGGCGNDWHRGLVKITITNLQERVEFWRKHFYRKFQGDSGFSHLKEHLNIFKGKDVLEIGPGEGRQFNLVYKISRSYSIADISKEVLDYNLYCDAKRRYLISSYDNRIDTKFDIIHFWYVIHHVLKEEVSSFFAFVRRHTRSNGLVFFNYPTFNHSNDVGICNDGKKTTKHDENNLLENVDRWYNIIDVYKEHKYSTILGIKR